MISLVWCVVLPAHTKEVMDVCVRVVAQRIGKFLGIARAPQVRCSQPA